MKTAQIIVRPFKDGSIRQNHKTSWFNATDLIKIANNYRKQIGLNEKLLKNYFKNDSTKEFIKEILDRENISQAYVSKKGKNGGTWVHPMVLLDLAMWLSPEFKYDAMKWLEDKLVKSRDESGESFKKMAASVAKYIGNDATRVGMEISKIAKAIKMNLHVNDWNNTTEEKLKQRAEIQTNISILLSAGVEINKACAVSIGNVLVNKRVSA